MINSIVAKKLPDVKTLTELGRVPPYTNGAASQPSLTGGKAPATQPTTKPSPDQNQPKPRVIIDRDFDLYQYRAEDGGIMDCWLDAYGHQWCYVTGYEAWYQWTGTHYAKDESRSVQRSLQGLMDTLNRAAISRLRSAIDAEQKDKEEIEKAKTYVNATKRSKSRVASVETMAQAQRAIAYTKLDEGNLLNLQNGTLDLDTLTLKPHDPDNHLTYVLPYAYDPKASASRFQQFIKEVLGDYNADGEWATDEKMVSLFQELMGYSLTNDTRHEVMIWLSGEGSNGKTTAITVLLWLLGRMCCSVDFQSIGLPGNYDLAEIPGKRVIFSTESERGGKTAEGYIKRIVSGEYMDARPIYGRKIEFKSTAKIWWGMNDKPIIKDTGNSIWRRLKLIPFNRTFTEQDKDIELLDKLQAELPGILNFALEGLKRLRDKRRFTESETVKTAVDEYKLESNPIAQWKNECTDPASTPATVAAALYLNYCLWCSSNGRQSVNSNNFSRELTKLRVNGEKTREGKKYCLEFKS